MKPKWYSECLGVTRCAESCALYGQIEPMCWDNWHFSTNWTCCSLYLLTPGTWRAVKLVKSLIHQDHKIYSIELYMQSRGHCSATSIIQWILTFHFILSSLKSWDMSLFLRITTKLSKLVEFLCIKYIKCIFMLFTFYIQYFSSEWILNWGKENFHKKIILHRSL